MIVGSAGLSVTTLLEGSTASLVVTADDVLLQPVNKNKQNIPRTMGNSEYLLI